MKCSENWLKQWVKTDLSTDALVHKLTMAGLEVDSVTPVAPAFMGVVVGLVKSIEPHPDAERLRVCSVDAGESGLLQIVCGAANVYAGMFAPVALVGAELPGDLKIKKSKLRGVESFGMLCSAKEIGIVEDAEGLLDLGKNLRPGQSIRDLLALDDQIIEVDLTPNRGDCLGLRGLARELGVLTNLPVEEVAIPAVASTIEEVFPIVVEATSACPRYLGRILRGINLQAQTPLWMKERLRRGGIRSLGPLVDVTNYVLLELGQPMHAFDLRKLSQEIRVRYAKTGETLTLLDGQVLVLTEGTLIIADQDKPLALAGIMGGEHSAISADTCDLFLECAFFSPLAIAGRARGYGLHTDSSHRFERGVDFQLQSAAMERATGLLVEIVGGAVGPITEVVDAASLPARIPIHLRSQRIEKLLGVSFAAQEVESILGRLGLQVRAVTGGWEAVPPSHRFDIEHEVDLIEELGRIRGYDQLPAKPGLMSAQMQAQPETRLPLSRIRHLLVDHGFQEVVTYSFVDPDLQQQVKPALKAIDLTNPISRDLSQMRTSLLPGLIKTALYNQNRQQARVRIFENGLKFVMQDNELKQEMSIAGLVAGTRNPEQWAQSKEDVDFFDLKADVEAMLDLTGQKDRYIFESFAEDASFHPGQCAQIIWNDLVIGRQTIGLLGTLHPKLLKELDLQGPVLAFELQLPEMQQASLPRFEELSKYPSIRRDMAIVVDNLISSSAIKACIAQSAGGLLKKLEVFDVYSGKGVESGRKSLALGLILQDSSSTLVDEQVDGVMEQILLQLQQKFQATLRE